MHIFREQLHCPYVDILLSKALYFGLNMYIYVCLFNEI